MSFSTVFEKYLSPIQTDSLESILEKMDIEEEDYNSIMYEVLGDLVKKVPFEDIVKNLLADKSMWNHPEYNELKYIMEEQDGFITNPFEVEEGVLQCKNIIDGKMCGSKRVFSYSRQSRSADEPMSTYATCAKCKCNWVYSG